ncbi:MAG TPA: hypothetical protein VMR75_01870 [Candidatus Saccharimonadales bacterium]|nr:hypothetical protein [Candidatus Saccharimonadales bacterium]
MRVQVEIAREVKIAAEVQAVSLGYPSLAIMLRVIATGLAHDYHASGQSLPPLDTPSATSSANAIAQAALPKSTLLPPPEQFTHWPDHFGPELAQDDPALYRLLIETGQVY